MARRQSSKGFKPKREHVWVTTLFNATSAGVTTANIPTPIVAPIDWTRGANFERGCTLKAIRGWYQTAYISSSTSTQPSWYLAISKGEVNEDHTVTNWTTATAYNSEDVLYTDGGVLAILTSTNGSSMSMSRQLDVKANRKLNSDDVINFQFVTVGASADWIISGVFRCLLQLP